MSDPIQNQIQQEPIQILEQTIQDANEFSQNSANQTDEVLQQLMSAASTLNEQNNSLTEANSLKTKQIAILKETVQEFKEKEEKTNTVIEQLKLQVRQEKEGRARAENQISALNQKITELTSVILQGSRLVQNGIGSTVTKAREFLINLSGKK